MNNKPLVSIVIPTYNNAPVLPDCLKTLKNQTYKNTEVLVVDGFSKDDSVMVAKKFGAKVFLYGPDQTKRKVFGAPFQRNYGVKKAKGKYVFYVDADMILGEKVVFSCVSLGEKGCDAVIVPEDSFGIGFWAACKKLERRAYWGDDNVEAPRFIKKTVWDKLGGLDDSLGADDWDFHDKLKESGYEVCRTNELILHNEGDLSLMKLIRKRFLYGRSVKKYVTLHRKRSTKHFFPLRYGFIKHWYLFVKDPFHALGFIFMRTLEYLAGFIGLAISILIPQKIRLMEKK